MPESLDVRDSAVVSSAGEPGPLSRLLREIFEAPSGDLLEGWKKELQPGDRLGRFELRREVGRGGFGAVYEAFDTELNRVVAVKTLRLSRPRRDLSSDWIKKEAEAVARLDHLCIVTLFDVGTCESGPYLVMELLRGRTLAQRIAEGPVPVAEALRIAEEMAKGLAHAHQRGVLHRDLKPANVFLCEDGRVKLLDFGLAHLLGAEGVSGAGTPRYMAPEQARGETVDQRADVFAAGRVLGEMVGERRPRRLERAIALATSTDPVARPRDGQALLDLLRAARRAVERPARLRRGVVLAGFGVVLGGVVVGVGVHRASRPVAFAHGKPSIAVLPFKNLSNDKDQEYFSDGVAEEILTALARIPGLWVPGRTSSFYFKGKDARLEDIGRELKVEHVLEGSVRRSGSKVRVSAEVVSVGTGERIWSRSFEREFTGIISIQDEIARAVVEALRVKLLDGRLWQATGYLPKSQEAYQSYLLGRHLSLGVAPESKRRAITALEGSVELDPSYPPAWAALGVARLKFATLGAAPWAEVKRQALEAASRAVELAPHLPVALAARASVRMYHWNWIGAKADLDEAVTRGPEDPQVMHSMTMYLLMTGRPAEAVAWSGRLVEKEPLDPYAWNKLAFATWASGKFDEADRAFARMSELAPDSGEIFENWGMLLVDAGRPEEGRARCEKQSPPSLACMAIANHALGRHAQAQSALEGLLATANGEGANEIASIYALRGDREAAFELLERAVDERGRLITEILGNRFLRPLHSDPRWAELLRKMNLPTD